VVAGGFAPFLFAGCTSNNGPTMARNDTSSDWFGVKKLAGLFKSDPEPISNVDEANPYDRTSLAFKGKPPGADLYVANARLAERQNYVEAAEEQYQRALEISATDLAALVGYAHLLDRQGRLDEATNYYQKAVQHHPTSAAAHNDLGLCYARRGMLDDSVAELSKAVELAPEKQLYRNNIATVFVEKGQPQRALEHLSALQQPGVAHYNLASLLHQRGQSSAATFHFAEAARLDPSLGATQQPTQNIAAAAGPRMTGVRAVEPSASQRPSTQWTMPAGQGGSDLQTAAAQPHASGIATVADRAPQAGADRNWSAYDVASSQSTQSGTSAARGSAYAMPPTPETAQNYSIPVSATVDVLPPVEASLPRY
jgi:tetratricopeptide (TPR) repeat protein